MISTDRKILEEGSAVRARMIDYGTICDELRIILASVSGSKRVLKISDKVFVHPTASIWKWLSRVSLFLPDKLIPADMVTAQDPFETGFMAWYISRMTGAKLELQVHTDFINPYYWRESLANKIRVVLARFLLPRADGIRVVSERIKNSLNAIGYKLKTAPVVLPIFVDIEKIHRTESETDLHKKYSQFDPIIIMVSRLTQEKNIGLALEAMHVVVKKFPKAGLVIVGSGPEEENLKLKTKNLKLDKKVIFAGWVDNTAPYYKVADAYLLTSNYEGFGLSLVEAALAGCPIVTTEVGLVGGLIKPEISALVSPPGDLGGLSKNLARLLFSPELRNKLSVAAQTVSGQLAGSKEEYLGRIKSTWEKVSNLVK